MNLFTRIANSLAGSKSSGSIKSSLDLWRLVYGGRESSSGITITPERALELSTYLACCRVLSNGVTQVPSRVMKMVNGDPQHDAKHPLSRLLEYRPNQFMNAFEFWEVIMLHLCVFWNAYVFVNRVGRDRKIVELLPFPAGTVKKEVQADDSIIYRVRHKTNGTERIFPAEAIWHIKGPSWDGIIGIEAITLLRNALGLTALLEESQANFQKNGAKMSGLYSVKDKLSPDRYKDLRTWFDEEFNKGEGYRPLILDGDAKFTPFAMSGVDQQLLETRKFQMEEICRCMGVMPIMIGHADKTATYASAEQMFLAHVIHSLSPWYARLESSVQSNLFTEEEFQAGYYYKFFPNALMRGASKDRSDFYQKALGSGSAKGWMTQNEVRAFEDLPRIDDPEADTLPQPSKSSETPSDDGGDPPADDPDDDPAADPEDEE
jgi:HK97 family phage portal protein